MVITDWEAMMGYLSSAPLCDGNHQWVFDEESGGYYCERCFVIKTDDDALDTDC